MNEILAQLIASSIDAKKIPGLDYFDMSRRPRGQFEIVLNDTTRLRITVEDATKIMTETSEQPTGLSLESICAEIYQHKNWRNLSFAEEMLVSRLEKSGHLRPTSQGFVGGLTCQPNAHVDAPSHLKP